MLVRQRDKFAGYLELLEREEEAIQAGDAERLASYVELEQSVITEICVLRKVIDPLEGLYQAAYPLGGRLYRPTESPGEIGELKATLERMGAEVLERNARNRAALRVKVDELRLEIAALRRWPGPRSSFAAAPDAPSLVDIVT